METDLMNLTWSEFQNSTIRTFKNLHGNENFSDVTLAFAGGKQLKAHRIILSSCSPFFKDILTKNPHKHPLLYLKGVDIEDMEYLMSFVYSGEVEIPNEGLTTFLEAANELQIDGLLQKRKGEGGKRKKRKFDETGTVLESTLNTSQLIPAENGHIEPCFKSNFDGNTQDKNQEVSIPLCEETLGTNDQIALDDENSVELEAKEPNDDIDQIDDVKFVEVIEDTTGGLYGFRQTEVETNHRQFECEYCPQSFSRGIELDGHVEKYHHIKSVTNLEPIKDELDQGPWNIVDMTEKTCNICFKKFTTTHSLKEHKDSLHEHIKFMCGHCDHISSSKRNLRGHMGKRHPDLPTSYNKVKAGIIAKPIMKKIVTAFTKPSKPPCPEEIKSNKSASEIEELMTKKAATDIEIEQKINTMMVEGDGMYRCKVCERADKKKFILKRHIETHLNGYQHECLECNASFKQRCNLYNHSLRHKAQSGSEVPVPKIPFPCDQCDMVPISKPALRIHKSRYHTVA